MAAAVCDTHKVGRICWRSKEEPGIGPDLTVGLIIVDVVEGEHR